MQLAWLNRTPIAMASGRINRNGFLAVARRVAGFPLVGEGITNHCVVRSPMLTTAWVRGLTSDSILTADHRRGILIHEHEASLASHSKRVTQPTTGVALGCRSGNAARRDLRITSDGRGVYKWTVLDPPCSGTTRHTRGIHTVVSVVYWTGEVERQLQKYSQVLRDIIWISVEDFIAQVGTIRDSEVRNKSVARRKSPLSRRKRTRYAS